MQLVADGIFILADPDPSWVEIDPDAAGGPIVAYGGPRLLWPQIADAWHRYTDLGRPAPDRFGLTAHDNGDQHLWLDHDHQAAGR